MYLVITICLALYTCFETPLRYQFCVLDILLNICICDYMSNLASILVTVNKRRRRRLLLFCHTSRLRKNKANLRDLIAATGVVILLKLDSNRRFFSPCDLEIWWMTPKNNRAPLLCYLKLYASFRTHWWIHTGVSLETPIWVKIDYFFSRVTLQFDGWPWKTIGHPFHATSSFVQHFVPIGEFTLALVWKRLFGSKSIIFLAVWPCSLTDDLEKQ